MKNKGNVLLVSAAILFFSCNVKKEQNQAQNMDTTDNNEIVLMTLDPGHFHAALVQKEMYQDVSPHVYVYAPEGLDLTEHLKRIENYNTRQDNPTHWDENIYSGPDYFEKMLEQKPGNVVVIAGNNAKKTEYISKSINVGLNVLADKPMVITPDDFQVLVDAFQTASKKDVLLYDIMTERYEITSVLQKELSRIPDVFGTLQKGTPDDPAVTKESVHHFFKYVSGNPLIRPAWYFDITQQGEGIVDVSTHLVDLVQWECFPGEIVDYHNEIKMLKARHWTTDLTLDQFRKVTGLENYPDFLMKYVDNGILKVYSNGEMTYSIKGIHAKVSVIWKFQAPEGAGDTHYSIMKGTGCNLIIRQGREENYRPELYVEKNGQIDNFNDYLAKAINESLQTKYPGISLEKLDSDPQRPAVERWAVRIPDKYRVGHEAHFGQVTKKYLEFLKKGDMPSWEVPNMIAKYYTTMEALKMARKK